MKMSLEPCLENMLLILKEKKFIQDILPNVNNDIKYERKFWVRFVINQLIVIPLICINCGKNNISLTENNTPTNPYIGRCSFNKCRKIYYLKDKTFLGLFQKRNFSTVLYILKLWNLEKK